MRRNIRERVDALAPFLTFDPDPYIVVGDDGRLFWMMDGFTTSDTYPYARHYRLGRQRASTTCATASRRPSTPTTARRRSTSSTPTIRSSPPIAAIFPTLFKDASAMPPATARARALSGAAARDAGRRLRPVPHDAIPTCSTTARICGPSRAEVGAERAAREQAAQTMEPNFVLMKLPGESAMEFVEILPFTPANRNNLIGWIAGRSDDAALRHGDRLQLPQDAARGRTAADRGAHRSERAAVRAAVAVEPAGLARAARQPDRHSGRPRAALRRSRSTCRPSAARCRSCGSSCSRCRTGWRTVRRSSRRWRRCSAGATSSLTAADAGASRAQRSGAVLVSGCTRNARSKRADPRSGPRSRRLPAADGRGKARGSGAASSKR